MKLFIHPVIMLILYILLPDLKYSQLYQVIVVSLVLALVTHITELAFLKDGTFWLNNIIDLSVSFIIIYTSQYLLANTTITVTSASITAFIITFTEFYQHLFILRTGRAIK